MLLRHGHVVAEAWWAPYAPQHPHILFSLTKSFTSTAVGLAVAEGRLSIDDFVLSFFPEDAPKHPSKNLAAMRVRHLLAMSTGQLVDSTEKAVSNRQGSWVKGFFSMPVKHAPGAPFVYNSGASHMLSAIVQKVTGQTLIEYLKPRLFEPLGIENMIWETDPQGVNTGGWGLSIKTEDIARFGQLYLQKGIWKGQQILPASWVEMATSKQVRNDLNPDSPIDWKQGYGFQFWRCQHNAYRGDGAFGQFCIVMPDQDAVLAITSGVSDMQSVLNLVWKHILPGMSTAAHLAPKTEQERLALLLPNLSLVAPRSSVPHDWIPKRLNRTYKLEANLLNLKSLQLDLSPEGGRLIFKGQTMQYSLEFANEDWTISRSGFLPTFWRPGRPTPSDAFAVAAACAWIDKDVLEIKARYYETPFYLAITCRFEGDQVIVQSKINVSFGPTQLPSLVGSLA
jgi:CubicO group peptidase (beta-lactamase class C family)